MICKVDRPIAEIFRKYGAFAIEREETTGKNKK